MDCSICCEKFNKSTLKPIQCGFCINFTACTTCVKRYLLDTNQTAHCMNCKHEWSRIQLIEYLPKTFITNEYKKRRQEINIEMEKSMMPATQPYVEIEIDRRKIQEFTKEIQRIRGEKYMVNTYSNRHLEYELEIVRKEHYIKCIIYEIRDKQNILSNNSNKTRERSQFIRKCPMEDCRGFLSTGWKCGMCKTKVCSKCHEIKKKGSEEEKEEEENENHTHVCDPNNIETAKLLKNDTKACPKCAAMIFKISGCDQMFCTQCHTAFSWNTGAIETKIIHNPHYFQYLREQANGREIPRNPLDNPCAEILPDGQAFSRDMIEYITRQLCDIPTLYIEINNNEIKIIIRKFIEKEMCLCNHIVTYHFEPQLGLNNNRDLRIKYMMNDITEDKYKQLLQIREKNNEKNHEFEMIFRTYVTAARDIILNYVNLPSRGEIIEKREEIYNELNNLRKYINDCFQSLQPVFNCKVWQIIERHNDFDVSRQTI